MQIDRAKPLALVALFADASCTTSGDAPPPADRSSDVDIDDGVCRRQRAAWRAHGAA